MKQSTAVSERGNYKSSNCVWKINARILYKYRRRNNNCVKYRETEQNKTKKENTKNYGKTNGRLQNRIKNTDS